MLAKVIVRCLVTLYPPPPRPRALGVPMTQHTHVEAWFKRCRDAMLGFDDICLAGAAQFGALHGHKFSFSK